MYIFRQLKISVKLRIELLAEYRLGESSARRRSLRARE